MKLSIITVTYNSAELLPRCLESVRTQTYPDIEHIIVDGGSKDRTMEIVNHAERSLNTGAPTAASAGAERKSNSIISISEPDEGIYDAMNKGIGMATGDVIGMLNSDDVYYDSGSAAKIMKAFEDPEVEAIHGRLEYTDAEGKVLRVWKSREFEPGLFSKSWTPAHPTFYCRNKCYEKHGLYRTDFKIAADVELMLRFLEVHKIKSRYVDELLVNMRAGGVSNRGLKSTWIITREMRRAFQDNELPFNTAKYLFHKGRKIAQFINP